jgi:ParB family transcriptional regulator, chromosome partitioning protein
MWPLTKDKTMTTATAQNKTEHSTEKEKAEKRRALGRGLESLLPRPKVVESPPRSSGSPDENPPFSQNRGEGGHPSVLPHSAIEMKPGASHSSPELRSAVWTQTDPPRATNASISAPTGTPEAADLRSAVPRQPQEPIAILTQAEGRVPGNLVLNLAIEEIDKNPFQTRYVHDGEALEELAESIKVNGVVQPIVVRPAEEPGRYILILGERRLHASKKAGKTTIPAMVRRVSEQQAAEMTIVENLQREDLSPVEQAEAFRVLSEEFKLTQAQIGERVGLSRESVSNYMRLLRLPREVMQLLAEKKIKFAEAKELLKLESDEKIVEAALYAVKHGYTIEQVEKLVLQMNGWLDSFPGMAGQQRNKSGARWVDPNVRAAQTDLERLLGVRVKIRDRKGKGKIVIEYSTVDDYERVVGMLRGRAASTE